jgi:hypothetical protein
LLLLFKEEYQEEEEKVVEQRRITVLVASHSKNYYHPLNAKSVECVVILQSLAAAPLSNKP